MSALQLPPLKALRAFESAARNGNFTVAADELSITHSAVSQQIKLLEDYLGQTLFAREARGVTLLPVAKEFFEQVQASLGCIASATVALQQVGRRRSLRVCTTPSLAMQWLMPRLAAFHALLPDTDVRLATLGRQFIDQADDDNDVIIRQAPMQRPGFSSVRCLEDFLVPVASPRYIAKNHLSSPSDLLGHPLLQVAGSLDTWPRWLNLAGVKVPSQLPGPMFDHQFLSLQAASNDMGLAMAPWCLLEEDLRNGRLRPLFSSPRLKGRDIHALYRTNSHAESPSRQFVDWLGSQGNNTPLSLTS